MKQQLIILFVFKYSQRETGVAERIIFNMFIFNLINMLQMSNSEKYLFTKTKVCNVIYCL